LLIILSLKDLQHHLINGSITAKDLWDHIKKQYEKPGILATFLSYQQILQFMITKGLPIHNKINTLYQNQQDAAKASIKISNQHFSFCILQACPDSYSLLFSTILTTSDMDTIKPDIITMRSLEEEAWWSSIASLLVIIKQLTKFEGECNYYKRTGHKLRDCRKKKGDKAEKKNPKNAVVTVE
jgi:gag-polypeptide of LTR copia-type